MVSTIYSILRDKGDVLVTKILEMPEEVVAKGGKGS